MPKKPSQKKEDVAAGQKAMRDFLMGISNRGN
jgi:hypothetical protein